MPLPRHTGAEATSARTIALVRLAVGRKNLWRGRRPQPDRGEALPAQNGAWEVNLSLSRLKTRLTPIKGELRVEAPWRRTVSSRIVAEFTPREGAAGSYVCFAVRLAAGTYR